LKSLYLKVEKWLQESGFPLEMEVAQALTHVGFEVSQSAYYLDPETSEAREIDVIATMESAQTSIPVRMTAVVECKSSRDVPWIVFRRIGPPFMPESVVGSLATTRAGIGFLARLKRNRSATRLPLFSAREYVGYGITQALKDKPNNAYGAVMNVAKAADMHLRSSDIPLVAQEVVHIVLPIVVTEAPLFETHLNIKGEMQLEHVQRSTLLWRNPSVGRSLSVIEIVDRSQFASFVTDLSTAARLITGSIGEEIAPLLQVPT